MKIDGQDVLFRYKDYRDGNRWKTKRMPGVEFIGRFLQHCFHAPAPHPAVRLHGAARGGREARADSRATGSANAAKRSYASSRRRQLEG